jgi:hypothetical protein
MNFYKENMEIYLTLSKTHHSLEQNNNHIYESETLTFPWGGEGCHTMGTVAL